MKRLRWSQDANRDIIAITQFFADNNPYAGQRMLSRIYAAAAGLAFMDTGREGRAPGTREKRVCCARRTSWPARYRMPIRMN